MASIFDSTEIEQFSLLTDNDQIRHGNIRGPVGKWTIKGNVRCGKYASINGPFNARGVVRIGNYCAFGQYVSLVSGNHRTDMPNQQIWLNERFGFKPPGTTRGPIEIGHNVWIGDKANVLSGVTVGHGAVIAAGATVSQDVTPFTIVGGVPAKAVRKRFSDMVIDQLLEIAWWKWDDDKIARNKAFFELELGRDDERDVMSIVKS